MKSLLKSKKGNIGKDIFAAIIVIFFISIMSIIGFIIGTAMLDQYALQFAGDDLMQFTIGQFRLTYSLFDKIIVIITGALVIAMGISSYKIASRPVFVVLSFILAGFYGFISYSFNFITQEMFKVDLISAVRNSFPATYLIGTNFHWLALTMIVIGMITLYGKKEKGQFLT